MGECWWVFFPFQESYKQSEVAVHRCSTAFLFWKMSQDSNETRLIESFVYLSWKEGELQWHNTRVSLRLHFFSSLIKLRKLASENETLIVSATGLLGNVIPPKQLPIRTASEWLMLMYQCVTAKLKGFCLLKII